MNINPFANVSLQDYLEIVQIVDSTFPIGSFNHSFGMENYLREDTVTDDKGYEEWQEAYLASQFKYGEGLVIKLVYDAMVTDNIDQVWYYDKVLTVSTQARETRQGTKCFDSFKGFMLFRYWMTISLKYVRVWPSAIQLLSLHSMCLTRAWDVMKL